jgi:hypothetical protein
MQHDTGKLGRRVFGIICTWANDESPYIWSDIIQQFPLNCFQVETGTRCEDVIGRTEGNEREGYCGARTETDLGNPHQPRSG